MRKLLLLWIVFLLNNAGWSQKLENIKATAQGNQIVVEYDLASANARDRYEIALYCSHNNFSAPLKQIQGDVGQNVFPGNSKKMIWQARQELKNYEGPLTFEVRGKLIAGALVFKGPFSGRRGKSTLLAWTGGASAESVKLDLTDKDGKVEHITTSPNRGTYAWAIPAKKKTGKYSMQITQGNEKTPAVPFLLKAKIPLLLKASPLALVPLIIILIPPPPPPQGELPKPPGGY